MQDVSRRPTTRATRAADCCNEVHDATDDGRGQLLISVLLSVDEPQGLRPVLNPLALAGGWSGAEVKLVMFAYMNDARLHI